MQLCVQNCCQMLRVSQTLSSWKPCGTSSVSAQHIAQLNRKFCIQGVLVWTERRSVMPLTCSTPLHMGVHQLISTTDNWLWPRK